MRLAAYASGISLLTAGAVFVLQGCGNDNARVVGASGGAAGATSGAGGEVTAGGTSDGGAAGAADAAESPLALPCERDSDCAEGLTCAASDGDSVLDGGPAGGYCTLECVSDEDCAAFDPTASCEQVGVTGLCFQTCAVGAPGGSEKCHGRIDLACLEPILGTTSAVCYPTCQSDDGCGERYCDLLRGVCVDEKPEGAEIGSSCDPAADDSGCEASCWPAGDDTGMCTGFCTLGDIGCNTIRDDVGPGEAACMLGATPNAMTIGDQGICAELCDCNDDCSGDGYFCAALAESDLKRLVGTAGFCMPPTSDAAAVNCQ